MLPGSGAYQDGRCDPEVELLDPQRDEAPVHRLLCVTKGARRWQNRLWTDIDC